MWIWMNCLEKRDNVGKKKRERMNRMKRWIDGKRTTTTTHIGGFFATRMKMGVVRVIER